MVKQIQKLADPYGAISRVKARLNKKCAVALSPYCEVIISMRMQGIGYREISAWLEAQGQEHAISSPTIWRNLKNTKLQVHMPYAEEMAEQWGGRIDLDLTREMAGQIVAQRNRVDKMQRQELEKQKDRPGYFDRRLSAERETLDRLVKTLHGMLKTPLDAAKDFLAARALVGDQTLAATEDATAVIKELILSGELQVGDELAKRAIEGPKK